MSRNKTLREDKDVLRTVDAIKAVYNFGSALPIVSSEYTDFLEKLGCLDGKIYSLALMRMYGGNGNGFGMAFREKEFPEDVYAAWQVLEDAAAQMDPASYIFSSGNMLALKLLLADFIKGSEDGNFSVILQQGNGRMLTGMGANITGLDKQIEGINKKAIQEKTWRNLPEQMVQSYIAAALELSACISDVVQDTSLKDSVEELRRQIADDKKPRPEDASTSINPASKYAKLKHKSGNRFKL